MVRVTTVAHAHRALEGLRASLLDPAFVAAAGVAVGLTASEMGERLAMSIEEADHALTVLGARAIPEGRMLEIGSGPGILAAALRTAGVDVTTLEPGGRGIEINRALAHIVMDRLCVHGPHLEITAEELDPREHGRFDFVFSHNVLEHVGDLDGCIAAVMSVLAPVGAFVSHCPNYRIPYEPHYGSWLVPLRPQWSRPLLSRKRLKDDGVWESLNFITAGDVRRNARRHGATVTFDRGEMAAAFERIGTDASFEARHGFLVVVYRVLRSLGLMPLLRRVPGSLLTPMTFTLRKAEERRG